MSSTRFAGREESISSDRELLLTPILDTHIDDSDGNIFQEADDLPTAEVPPSLEEDNKGGLGRHLGLYSTTLLITSRMIGTGIFSTPSSIASSVGSVGAALLLWILGFLISFCGLFVWMEFGCLFPKSGGEKVYLEAAYPRPRLMATTVFGVQAVLLNFTAGSSIVFAQNSVLAASAVPTDWQKREIAIMVSVAVMAMHTFIPKWGVRIMNILAIVKIFILAFIVLTGGFVLTGGATHIPNPKANFRNPFVNSSTNTYDYTTALFKVLATYQGWSNAAYVLNEVKNPVHTLNIAGPLGLGTVGVLYILANLSYFTSATLEDISRSGVTVAAFFLGRVFGAGVGRVAAGFAALSALGNVMTVTFTLSRVHQELAKEGLLPFSRFWASAWPTGSPSAAMLLLFSVSLAVIVATPFGDSYNFILDVTGYPVAMTSAAVTIGLFILRRTAGHLHRPLKVWLPLAYVFLASQFFLLTTPFIQPQDGKGDTSLPYWLSSVIGTVVVFSGVLYWLVWWVILPLVGRYEWTARESQLRDGTVIVLWHKTEVPVVGRHGRSVRYLD